MPPLQVRDFPKDLYEQLREYAAANHRSIAQQTIVAVDQMINGAKQSQPSPAEPILDFDTEVQRQARREKYCEILKHMEETNQRILERRGGVPVPTDLATKWIREDRDGNHGHPLVFDKTLA